jgi:hypothetical protein
MGIDVKDSLSITWHLQYDENLYKVVSPAEKWPTRQLFQCLGSHAASGMALAGPCMQAGTAPPMAFVGLRATKRNGRCR